MQIIGTIVHVDRVPEDPVRHPFSDAMPESHAEYVIGFHGTIPGTTRMCEWSILVFRVNCPQRLMIVDSAELPVLAITDERQEVRTFLGIISMTATFSKSHVNVTRYYASGTEDVWMDSNALITAGQWSQAAKDGRQLQAFVRAMDGSISEHRGQRRVEDNPEAQAVAAKVRRLRKQYPHLKLEDIAANYTTVSLPTVKKYLSRISEN